VNVASKKIKLYSTSISTVRLLSYFA